MKRISIFILALFLFMSPAFVLAGGGQGKGGFDPKAGMVPQHRLEDHESIAKLEALLQGCEEKNDYLEYGIGAVALALAAVFLLLRSTIGKNDKLKYESFQFAGRIRNLKPQ